MQDSEWKDERWFQIDLGYACFGMQSINGTVTETAPIGKWMVGKTLQEIKPWLLKKNAIVIEIKL